jgi:hypothetical protein
MTGDLRVCGLVEPLGLEWTQRIVLSRSQCGGLRSLPEPVVGGSGAMRTRLITEIVASRDSVCTLFGATCFWAVTFIRLTSFP